MNAKKKKKKNGLFAAFFKQNWFNISPTMNVLLSYYFIIKLLYLTITILLFLSLCLIFR